MYRIKYIEHKSLFYVEIENKINHKQIIEFLENITEKAQKCQELFLITDYRNAILDETDIAPIEKIGYFTNTKMKDKLEHIKWAHLSNGYMLTTGAMLLYQKIKDEIIDYMVFTTEHSAFAWMGLSNADIDKLITLHFQKELK